MEGALDDLLRHPALWRARESLAEMPGARASVATGFPVLDARLPGAGWPLGALTEVLYETAGIGELSLLLPALGQLAAGGRWLAWIAPPWHIAAPALEVHGVDPARVLLVRRCSRDQAMWAAEQALGSGACAAVLLWLRHLPSDGRSTRRGDGFKDLRRLQLAAEAGTALGVLFRDARARREASPAALRLELCAGEDGLQVTILKSRGGRRGTIRSPLQTQPATACRGEAAVHGNTP
jgi:cell division inhibitor SulA/protein ImuA